MAFCLHNASVEQPGGIDETIMDRYDSSVFDSFRGSRGGAGWGWIGNTAALIQRRSG
jgi:hypothetical protein